MPSALSHDPSISTPGASTDNAIVIFDGTGGTGFGNSTILVDSGGNGRIGIAADTDIITVTAETVTIAGKLVATSIDVGDGAVTVDVTQSNHSLTVGMPIKVTGANQYAAAQANSAANAEVVGIVTSVASSSAFTMTLAGEVTTATAVPDSTSPGDIVYLSASSAGAVTTTEPSTAGQISKPIGVITEANNKMIMLPFRGEVISSATDSMDLNGTELVLDVDADTSITADTDDQIDIRLSGADDFQFTANTFSALGGSLLKFFDSDNSNYFTLAPNATTTANIDYTWPAAGPGSNGLVLSSTTAGVLSWAAAGGTAVAGTTDNGLLTFVNSGSTFAAESTLTFPFNTSSHGNTNDLGTLTVTGAATFQTGNSWKTGQNPPFYFVNLDPNGADRSHVMRIRGGANASNANVLEVQDYGGNTDFKVTGDGEVSVYQGGDRVSVQGGLAKAFVRFYNTVMDSRWNVSSITDHGTGDWTVNMTNGMATADDHSVVSVPKSGDATTNAIVCRPSNDWFTATTVRITGLNKNGVSSDPSGSQAPGICAVIYGVF